MLSDAGDMALNGPYFSQLLLVVIYITGIRFTVGIDERERQAKGDRFLSIAMSMIADEMTKPSSIPTIRKFTGNGSWWYANGRGRGLAGPRWAAMCGR